MKERFKEFIQAVKDFLTNLVAFAVACFVAFKGFPYIHENFYPSYPGTCILFYIIVSVAILFFGFFLPFAGIFVLIGIWSAIFPSKKTSDTVTGSIAAELDYYAAQARTRSRK